MSKECNKDSLDNIEAAILVVPAIEVQLLADLNECKESKEPRSDAMDVLQKYMFSPTEEWQYKAIGIVSGVPADKLKQLFEMARKSAEIMNEIKESHK
jgi:hypothetical protein